MIKTKIIFILCLIVLSTIGCNKENNVNNYQYSVPEPSTDGWVVGSVSDVGINVGLITDMMGYINNTANHNIHNILIFKDEKLVFEEYFEGYLYLWDPPGSNGDYITYDKKIDHYLASVSKTITSVIFGAAIKEGFIDNLDEKIINIFPEYADILTGDKADITLKHLLTMSSGLAWDESSTSYENITDDVLAIFNSDDLVAYTLSRTLLHPPGTQFIYNSGGTNVLGAVIEKVSGMSLLNFANEYLFDPLNIEGGSWKQLPSGLYFASGGISLIPRDLAKIGQLFLNGGYWGDHQIVTEAWIDDSVEEHIATISAGTSYGYQWWLKNFHVNGQTYRTYYASGWGDQFMFVFPEQEMIIVINGGNYLSGGSIPLFSLIENFILESLQ